MSEPFESRWVRMPAHVRELEHAAALPAGFRASGIACGIKRSGRPDLGILACDSPGATSAARFTRSGTAAPPVLVSRERCRLDALRAVVVNSGNANAAVGAAGTALAVAMQQHVSAALGLDADTVAVASTGVIGVPLDEFAEAIETGIEGAAQALDPGGAADFNAAIMTTDRFEKRAELEVELPGGSVRLSAQCKGAGMISPRFATMLCFVQTDALLSAETADLLLGVCVKRSFDRVSVDGQLSTNDTAILICSGESGVEVASESEDELRFGEALDALLRRLALQIVRDGEGSARVGRVLVSGGEQAAVERAARAVADSPLVKTALNGGDPNWGRIVQAVGGALPDTAPLPLDVWIEDVQVCARGEAVPYDEPALAAAVAGAEVEYALALPGSGAEAELFFSDLGHEYVRINAEYTT